jgi:hypothetical protein
MQTQGGVVITAIGVGQRVATCMMQRNGMVAGGVDGSWYIVSSRNLDTRGPRRGVPLNMSVLATTEADQTPPCRMPAALHASSTYPQ